MFRHVLSRIWKCVIKLEITFCIQFCWCMYWPSSWFSFGVSCLVFWAGADGQAALLFLPQSVQSILEQQAWEVIKWRRLNSLGRSVISSETQQVTTATRQWKIICQLVGVSAEVCSVPKGFFYLTGLQRVLVRRQHPLPQWCIVHRHSQMMCTQIECLLK